MSVICCLISFISVYITIKDMRTEVELFAPEIASIEIKRAMIKFGPNYHYRMLRNGTLQVNKGDGKWLRLRYERRKEAM